MPIELTAALDGALSADGPSVVSVECSADEIPPFAPFLATNSSKKTASNISTPTPKDQNQEYTDVAASA